MQAVYIERYGGLEVMRIGELPKPGVGPDEVLVKVKAASVNPVDWKIRDGALALLTGKKFPKILGVDFAGEIETIGAAVKGFAAGDKVYGGANVIMGKPGSHAEYVAIKANLIRKIPAKLMIEHAAVIPVAATTALNGLEQCGDLKDKEVLVIGATGGVGHFMVQLAKEYGARVTAVCSGKNSAQAKVLGADVVIDYQQEDVTKNSKQYDAIFDVYGHTGYKAVKLILKKGGTFGSPLSNPLTMIFGGLRNALSSKKIIAMNASPKHVYFQILEDMLLTGKIKPVISQVFTLEQAKEAYAAQAKGTVGKILLTIEKK